MAALFSEDFFLPALWWLFVAATLLQILFAGLVLRFFYGWFPRVFGSGAPETPIARGVSVIVCARNEAANLRSHLPAILEQKFEGEWELIVVDDASTDDSTQVLLDFQRLHPRLHIRRIFPKTLPGKKQALTAGIQAAKFDHILLTDADCAPETRFWIQYMTAPFALDAKTDIVLGYGPMNRSPQGAFLEKWARFETAFTAMQYSTFAQTGMPYMGVGRNLAFRKEIFEQTGGFTKHRHLLSGDDDLLVNAAATATNTVCCLHPEAFVYSNSKSSWGAWFRQKRRHLSASPAYKRKDKLLLGLLSLSHVLHFFLLFLLLAAGYAIESVLYLWLLRSLLLFIVYRKVLSTLREPGLLPLFPFFDALLALYFGVLIPIFLIAHKTRSWN